MAKVIYKKKQLALKYRGSFEKALPEYSQIFKKDLENAKNIFLKNLRNTDIAKELSGDSPEDAQSLILSYGNLFSYLGFYQGTNPYQNLENFLIDYIKYDNNLKIVSQKMFKVLLRYTISMPSQSEIEKATPLTWDRRRSWVRVVEKTGLDNFHQYFFQRLTEDGMSSLPNSRSTTGIQTRTRLRKTKVLTPRPFVFYYLDKMRHDISSTYTK